MKVLAALLLAGLAGAASADEIQLPCQQHFSPTLTAATYWEDAAQLDGLPDWHRNKKVAALVERIAPRDVPVDDAVAQIATFRKSLTAAQGKILPPLLFVGLVEDTDRQRREVIEKIRGMAERQRNLSQTLQKVTDELSAAPDQSEIQQRRGFLLRDYDSLDKTLRYACQIPVDLDARLGAFARALQD